MPRPLRPIEAGLVYHVINRGNGRAERTGNRGRILLFHSPQCQFDERDAAYVEREGAGHGRPEAEAVERQDHEAHVGEPELELGCRGIYSG